MIRAAKGKIVELNEWYKSNDKFQMYSASILIIWDAENPEPHARVRLIDMAHVIKLNEGEQDENVSGGIKNLIDIFEDLSKENN